MKTKNLKKLMNDQTEIIVNALISNENDNALRQIEKILPDDAESWNPNEREAFIKAKSAQVNASAATHYTPVSATTNCRKEQVSLNKSDKKKLKRAQEGTKNVNFDVSNLKNQFNYELKDIYKIISSQKRKMKKIKMRLKKQESDIKKITFLLSAILCDYGICTYPTDDLNYIYREYNKAAKKHKCMTRFKGEKSLTTGK